MMIHQRAAARPTARRAFTLVEMMVSMTLVLFIMLIMSEAFTAGLESFRQLKAIGDLSDRLRAATNQMRTDLAADHFDGGTSSGKLSGQTLPIDVVGGHHGFFRIWQGSQPTGEGNDPDLIASTRATDHMLHFSVKLTGNRRENFFAALTNDSSLTPSLCASGGPAAYRDSSYYRSQWAEIAYFLRPTGTSTTDKSGGTTLPLFALYRRVKVITPASEVSATANGWNTTNRAAAGTLTTNYYDVSAQVDPASSPNVYFNTESAITVPVRRFGMQALTMPPTSDQPNYAGLLSSASGTYAYTRYQDEGIAGMTGADLLLVDVISFDIKVLSSTVPTGGAAPTEFLDLFRLTDASASPSYYTTALTNNNLNSAFTGATVPRVFDTWTNADTATDGYYDYSSYATAGTYRSLPLNIKITAIQITLRIWDTKTQNSRQITIRQDL